MELEALRREKSKVSREKGWVGRESARFVAKSGVTRRNRES